MPCLRRLHRVARKKRDRYALTGTGSHAYAEVDEIEAAEEVRAKPNARFTRAPIPEQE